MMLWIMGTFPEMSKETIEDNQLIRPKTKN